MSGHMEVGSYLLKYFLLLLILVEFIAIYAVQKMMIKHLRFNPFVACVIYLIYHINMISRYAAAVLYVFY